MDVFYYAHKIWRGMSADWTGSPPASHLLAEDRTRLRAGDTDGRALDGACAQAGLRRRCSLTFDINDADGTSMDPQLFLALLQGVPSAHVLSDIREACVGRLLAAASLPKVASNAGVSEKFVRDMFKATRGLVAGWQRVRLFEVFCSAGYRCATRVFDNPHLIPDVYRCFMLYDPGQSGQHSRGALPSDTALLLRAQQVLAMHASVNANYHDAQRLLQEFREKTARDLETYMPPNVYSPDNTSRWYDRNGDLTLTHSD